MGRFVVGLVTGVVMALLAEFTWVRFGFVNPRADIPENGFERSLAMPALDASVDHRASNLKNPIQPTEANLIAGIKIYQANCASCHGDIRRRQSMFADALYPRAPQFMEDPPDMPENENFYIIEHGVRLSGMPAWGKILNQQQAWQLTTFLKDMDKLPPDVATEWKKMAEVDAQQAHLGK
jgi:thiosulfate dehydrogenase